jgi:hypothetical protein
MPEMKRLKARLSEEGTQACWKTVGKSQFKIRGKFEVLWVNWMVLLSNRSFFVRGELQRICGAKGLQHNSCGIPRSNTTLQQKQGGYSTHFGFLRNVRNELLHFR